MDASEPRTRVSSITFDEETRSKLTILYLRVHTARAVENGVRELLSQTHRGLAALEAEYAARRAVLERDALSAQNQIRADALLAGGAERALGVATTAALVKSGVQPVDARYFALKTAENGDVTGADDTRPS